MANYLFLLLILACPLMMIWMMRSMHGGHGGKAAGGHDHTDAGSRMAIEDLRRRRGELDREIEEREAEEETPAPVGGGWR